MDLVGSEPKAKRRRRDTDDGRAARKRELDRLAQRATRERTKNRIADLEQRIASLESGDRNGEIAQLTRTIGDLRNENSKFQNALVKMRFAINEALSETENSARRDSMSTTSHHSNGARHDSNAGISEYGPLDDEYIPNGIVATGDQIAVQAQQQRLQNLADQGYVPSSSNEIQPVDYNAVFDMFDFGGDNTFMTPSPLSMRMPRQDNYLPIAPDELKWKTSDDAFQKSLAVSQTVSMDFDEGTLVKAILLGWESIGVEAQHPVFIALRCVDQRVFGTWTFRPQRLATMYICATSLRWRANRTDENKEKVPAWFLPRPAQEKIQHPLVIDFLVWPGLRERLVFEYEKYTRTGQFSYCFVEYFHFNWPFPDEQVAEYDPTTGLITGMSKLFREYVFDLKNWTMLPQFFANFPEMRADIEMWHGPPRVGYQKGPWT